MRIPIVATLFVAVIAILLSFWCTLFPGSAFCPAPGLTPTLEGSAPPGVAYLWLTPDKVPMLPAPAPVPTQPRILAPCLTWTPPTVLVC